MAKTNGAEGLISRSALRRQREKEQRFKTVLKAAETLFAQKGFRGTSIEEIADLAEVSTGAVYFYFKNKEDILIKLMEEIGIFLREWLGGELDKHPGTIEGFSGIGVAFLQDFCVNHPEKIKIFFRESVGHSREVEDRRREMFDRLTGEIRRALEELGARLGRGFVSPSAPEVMAICVVGIYERMACQYVLASDRNWDLAAVVDETAAFMRHGIRGLMIRNPPPPEKQAPGLGGGFGMVEGG